MCKNPQKLGWKMCENPQKLGWKMCENPQKLGWKMCNDMYKRKIENQLQAWLDDSSHKPRQVMPNPCTPS